MTNLESVSSSPFCLWEAQAESSLWDVLVIHKYLTSCVQKADFVQKEFQVYQPRAGHFRAASLLLLLQTSFKYLAPKLPLSGRKRCHGNANWPGWQGPWGRVMSPLPRDSHACIVEAMQEVPMGWVQPGRGGSSGGAAFCWWQILKAGLRGGCGFNSLFS